LPDDLTSSGTLRLREAEEKMRRALGLTNDSSPQPQRPQLEPHRHKRRFVADGEVPVTVLPSSGRRSVVEDTERVDAERHGREAAERSLAEAQHTIRDLQTRLAHAEMALNEAHQSLAAERQRTEEAITALQQAREQFEAVAVTAKAAPKEIVPKEQKKTRHAPAARRGRPPAIEPKPVKWWLSGRKVSKR